MSKRRQIGMIAADMRDGDLRASREGDDEPGRVLRLSTALPRERVRSSAHHCHPTGLRQ